MTRRQDVEEAEKFAASLEAAAADPLRYQSEWIRQQFAERAALIRRLIAAATPRATSPSKQLEVTDAKP